MSLFMFCSIGGVGELLGTIELHGVLATEGLVPSVRPHVNFPVFRPGKRSIAIVVLKRAKGDP